MAKIKIGMGQVLVEGGAYAANMDRACAMIARAAQAGCAAVVLPECLDAGWTDPSARVLAEPIPGPTSAVLTGCARAEGIYVVAGLTERAANGRLYNTAVLISPGGSLLGRHRKINELAIAHDLYTTGDSLSVIETGIGRVGLTVCADNFPDSLVFAHSLARMGAQLILSPCAWVVDGDHDNKAAPYGSLWLEAYTTLGRMYDVTVIGSSCVGWLRAGPWKGRKCIGSSLAVGPGGHVLTAGSYGEAAETLIVAEVEPLGLPVRGTDIASRLRGQCRL